MKRTTKLAVAILGTLAFIGIAGGGAQALLSDGSTLTGNSLTSGTAGMLVSNSQAGSSTTYEKVREGFTLSLNPGQTIEKYFLLKNVSPSEFMLNTSVIAAHTSPVSPLHNDVFVTFTAVDAQGNTLPQGNGAEATLAQLGLSHLPLPGPAIGRGAAQRYKVSYRMSTEVTAQSQAMNYDLIFTGTQAL
jgi:hypothetical protein